MGTHPTEENRDKGAKPSMALLQSTFLGRSVPVPGPLRVRGPRNTGLVSVRAEAAAATAAPPTSNNSIVLMDKADAGKVHRLKTRYFETIMPLLKEEFKYENVHQIPKIEKIVVNCGMGDAAQNAKGLEAVIKDLAQITGQRPVKTKAKYSIATFKIREGQPLGVAVTLRRKVMYAFLDRLINLGLPRTRDFIGLNPNSFDGHGNYSLGMQEQGVFPELSYEQGKRGMDITIKTTAKTDQEAYKLLQLMGMPFKEGTIGGGSESLRRGKRMRAHHFGGKRRFVSPSLLVLLMELISQERLYGKVLRLSLLLEVMVLFTRLLMASSGMENQLLTMTERPSTQLHLVLSPWVLHPILPEHLAGKMILMRLLTA